MPIPAPLSRLPGDLTACLVLPPFRRSLAALAGLWRGSPAMLAVSRGF